jgi:hypothetical protein
MAIVVTLILLCFLLFVLYYGYCVVTNTPPFWVTKPPPPPGVPGGGASDGSGGEPPGYCTFEGEDLLTGRVYTVGGSLVSENVSPIACNKCNQYVYKNDEGCVGYTYDFSENTYDSSKTEDPNTLCDPLHPERKLTCVEPHGLCTPGLSPSKKCSF